MSSSFKSSWVVVAVAVVFGTGCGGASLEAGEGLSTRLHELEGSSSTSNLAFADFNGDGHADLAAANPDSQRVSVFLSEGAGTLAPAVSFEAGEGSTLAAGDFNADGLMDLQVTNEADGTVTRLMGHGPGGFAPPVVQPE